MNNSKQWIKRYKHGSWLWENETMEQFRETETMCFSCEWYNPNLKIHCQASSELFELTKKYNLATIVTRCGQCPGPKEDE